MSRMDDPAIVPLLESVFWHSPRDLQRAILLVIAAKAGPEEEGFFSEILGRHKDGSVLKSALHYFGKLGDSRLIFEKVFPFLDHPYNDVKEAALEASISVNNPEVNKKFQAMATGEKEIHRMMAFHALGRFALAENMPYIVKGLKDASPDVRRVAVEAMNGFVNTDLAAMNMLESSLSDENPAVRLAAIDALGSCNLPESVDLLLKVLKDADPWVRARCVESLGKKGLDAIVPQLAELLQDEQVLVVIKTIEALAAFDGEVAFKYLLPMVDHPEPEVQDAAAAALSRFRDKIEGGS
jgi:HEAT repeat protein